MPTYAIDIQTGARVPTTATFRCDQESFERTRAVLVADRGAGDSYYRCRNSDDGDIRKYSFTGITLADVTPPRRSGNSKNTGNRTTRGSALQPFY